MIWGEDSIAPTVVAKSRLLHQGLRFGVFRRREHPQLAPYLVGIHADHLCFRQRTAELFEQPGHRAARRPLAKDVQLALFLFVERKRRVSIQFRSEIIMISNGGAGAGGGGGGEAGDAL